MYGDVNQFETGFHLKVCYITIIVLFLIFVVVIVAVVVGTIFEAHWC